MIAVEKRDDTEMLYQQRIKYLSYRLHLSKRELAQRAGMTIGALERILDSDTPNISLEQAAALAEVLEVPMNYLILGE